MSPHSHIMDEHDIEELNELLFTLQNDDALRLDATQGLLAALTVGPPGVEDKDWLAMVLGEQPAVSDAQTAQRLVELLMRLKRAVEYGIEHYAFDAIFAEMRDADGEASVDAGGWCEGFGLGVDLQAEVWEAQMQIDDSLISLLSPIVALGVDDGVFSEIRDPNVPPLSEAEREDLMNQLPSVLADVRHYWDEVGSAAASQEVRQLH
jgi:uncharacterized protein